MTNFIEKLKQVAAGRTQGEWRAHNQNALKEWLVYGPERQLYFSDGVTKCASDDPRPYPLESTESNAQFIALAANCFDELVAVAEAAMEVSKRHNWLIGMGMRICDQHSNFNAAIEKLRQKVEGEGE